MKQQNSLRKAAILVASLDRASADRLLDQMPSAAADRVRLVVADLDDVDRQEQAQVIEEFMRVGPMVPKQQHAGIELDNSLLEKFATTASEPDEVEDPPVMDSPFMFLHEAAADVIAPILLNEQPQTIAVVLAHLTPDQASDVLVRLPAESQSDVIRRLVDLDPADAQVVRDISKELETLLSDQLHSDRRRSAGMAAVSSILSAARGNDRQAILKNLARQDAGLADMLDQTESLPAPSPLPKPPPAKTPAPVVAPEPPTREPQQPTPDVRDTTPEPTILDAPIFELDFSDVTELDNLSLAKVLRDIDPDVALLALIGATGTLVDRILKQLPSRDAKTLRKRLDHVGPMRLSDVEQAQQEIAKAAGQLAAKGEIDVPASRRFAVAA